MKLTERETETSGETSTKITAQVPIIEPSYNRKGSEKEKLELSDSSEMKYREVFHHLMEKQKILFGLEEFVYDKNLEATFDAAIKTVEERARYTPPSHEQYRQEFYTYNKQKQVDRKITELKNAIGRYVCVQGDFQVESIEDEYFLLSYPHPVTSISGLELKLVVQCTRRCMTSFGIETLSRLDKINLRIFGTITYYNEEASRIDVNPITIH